MRDEARATAGHQVDEDGNEDLAGGEAEEPYFGISTASGDWITTMARMQAGASARRDAVSQSRTRRKRPSARTMARESADEKSVIDQIGPEDIEIAHSEQVAVVGPFHTGVIATSAAVKGTRAFFGPNAMNTGHTR